MENLLLNGLSDPTTDVKYMDDCIIQGMNITLSNEEIVNQWDAKIRRKLLHKLEICDSEKVFEDVLKDYLRVLKEQARNFKEKKVLLEKVSRHLRVFHLVSCSTGDRIDLCRINHLDYIEDILIFLCNLELETVRHLKRVHVGKEYNKTVKRKARKLINNLSVNLFHQLKRIIHVLLKLDYKPEQSLKDIMHIVYHHYLINLPVMDRSDLSFCRYYLLFQKWKSLNDKNAHQWMDRIMFFKLKREPEYITNNRLLKSILLPATESIVDLVDVLTNGQQVAVNAYFRFIAEKNEDDEIRVPQAIELDSDEDNVTAQQLLFEPSEREKRCNGFIKSEQHRIPVQENAPYVEISTDDGQVVCVIDDDSDMEEVCVQDNKRPRRRRPRHKSVSSRPVTSFLGSICLSDDGSSHPAGKLSATEEERPILSTPPAESTILPILTAYVESVRRKGIMEADILETSTVGLESFSIRVEREREAASSTDVLSTISCENERDSVQCKSTVNKIVSSESCDSKNYSCGSVTKTSVGVQSIAQSDEAESEVTSNEMQSTNSSGKCTCCCRHSVNINSSTSVLSETNKTNKSVTKPTQKTVEIQTESIDSFSYLCGMITPPSDRTADENSPTSMENICIETDIHNSGLRSGNTNIYACVPNNAVGEPYVENNSRTQYESDVETHSSNYTGICETSTQVCNFDHAKDSIVNEGIIQESVMQNSSEDIQERNLNLEESLGNSAATQIEDANQGMHESELDETLVEHTEQPVNENELTDQMKTVQELVTELQLTETRTNTEPEQINENEFNEPDIEESEEVSSEFELNETHMDDTALVSEIEVNEEPLSEVEISETENSVIVEQEQERSEFEHCDDTSDAGIQESHHDYAATSNEEYQIIDAVEENCVLREAESTVNNTDNTNSYTTDLSNVPIIIAEAQTTDTQESSIDIIPFDLINNVVLGESYDDRGIVMVSNVAKDGGESTKYTVYKIAAEVEEPNFVAVNENNHLSKDSKTFCSTVQNKSLNEKDESLIALSSNVTMSELQSHKIQASVTMAQLVKKANPKYIKNGENIKMRKRKTTEENLDKIIFTSDERVRSAPLSVFAQFEQSQSDLVENVFSGPIEVMNGRTNINCDNSNSNDSFCLFDSNRSSVVKECRYNTTPINSPVERGSPISPPYENIHAQEYENHILRVNMENLGVKPKSILEPRSCVTNVESKPDKGLTSEIQNKIEVPKSSLISSGATAKRKHSDNNSINKRLKVNFGHTEIRIIPTDHDGLINPECISRESMQEYNVAYDDPKLMYLEPEVVVKLNSSESVEAMTQQRNRCTIFNTLMLEKKREAENTCIKMRIDYKKPAEDNSTINKHMENSSYSNSSLSSGSSLSSAISKQVDTFGLSGLSPPSGYIPTLNSPKPGLKRDSEYRNRDYGRLKSGSRFSERTGRKRNSAPKAQQLKNLPEPASARKQQQRRTRGRPKKSETRKSPQNISSLGVLYADGPFRLG